MHAVRVVVETDNASVEYLVHVRNRSRHALQGARRSGWRRYPQARAVSAEFVQHAPHACSSTSIIAPVRRVFHRTSRRVA